MKKLLITLMLISPFSFADWGDVYYCQMTNYSRISLKGERTDYVLEKLQFKLDETKKAMVFGKGGTLSGMEMEIRQDESWPVGEKWFADDTYTMLYFSNGKFLYSSTMSFFSTAIHANCDKF